MRQEQVVSNGMLTATTHRPKLAKVVTIMRKQNLLTKGLLLISREQ